MTALQKLHLPTWLGLLAISLLIVFIIASLLLGSGSMGGSVGNVFSDIVAAPLPSLIPTPGSQDQSSNRQATQRLIIRTGSLQLLVKDSLATQQAIEQMVSEMASEEAFVVSSSVRGTASPGLPYIEMNIRVPASRFTEVMDRLSAMALEASNRTEAAQDVTADYVDLAARLEALEAARDRLRQIMQESSTTEELLLAEQQLTQREADIESIKGQMQFLSQSAQLSSITIELSPYLLSQPVDSRWRPAETVRHAFDTLVAGMRGFADFAIFFSIAILPWLLFFGAIGYVIVRVKNRWRARQSRIHSEGQPTQES